MAQDDPEKVDLNLDEEPVAESAAEVEQALKAAAAAAGAVPEAVPQAVMDRLARLQAEKDELTNMFVRRQADFENYKKRIERERGEDRQRATALVIEHLLPVLDAFERALAAHADPAYEEYRKGFELIYRQILDALARYGFEAIEAVGKAFDPHLHHAVDRVESTAHEDGTVLYEHQRGYMLRDTVLRPAMVRVSHRPEKDAAAPDSDSTPVN